jgi:hypothetical protein
VILSPDSYESYQPTRWEMLRLRFEHWWLRRKWTVLRPLGIRPHSNMVEHARRELGRFETDQRWIDDQLLVVQAFADAGHSGVTASIALAQLERLLRFQNLAPLTTDPGEWMDVGDRTWQNRRRSDAFSTDGGRTYYLLDDEKDAGGQRPVYRAEVAV